mgnify:CR=1 FL=1
MRFYLYLIFQINFLFTLAAQTGLITELDSLYREDQFYVSVTYNSLINMPINVSQNSFSPGLHLGFVRDFPLNKRRNIALALGLGYSFNSYNHNIRISESNPSIYTIINNSNFVKNNLNLFEVDFKDKKNRLNKLQKT